MTSGPPSAPELGPALVGPVAVCVDRPLLALDRAFTYEAPASLGVRVGSVVRVPFHGRAARGWVLGPAEEVPARVLPIERLVAPRPAFDAQMLELLRWVAERYVAPLASVIGRAVPPRVVSEEGRARGDPPARGRPGPGPRTAVLSGYRGAGELLRAIEARASGAFALRPAPEEEAAVCVEAVDACLRAGRRALVLVPEADPVPATARALQEAFGTRALAWLGGDRRARYRAWLEAAEGRFDVVVATRPGVFAPLADVGLIWVARESHPALREDRAPYYHAREVALARARLAGAVCVLAALCPSAETAALGLPSVAPPGRRWPPVEVVAPGPEGRAPRLVRAIREARRGFLFSPLPGAGVARVCRACGEPARCAPCGGSLRASRGVVRCVVCGAEGRCPACGGTTFGLDRGGVERVEAWASRVARVPVRRAQRPRLPGAEEILVGGPEDVRDLGPAGLELVAILDADLARRRPGLAARERALSVWMEAVGWASPGGRAIVQAADRGDDAVQALVRGRADRFHERERERRARAGFPVGAAVFRVVGGPGTGALLEATRPITLLVAEAEAEGDRAGEVCLLALDPRDVPAFGRSMREAAAAGRVERVEAEPHL